MYKCMNIITTVTCHEMTIILQQKMRETNDYTETIKTMLNTLFSLYLPVGCLYGWNICRSNGWVWDCCTICMLEPFHLLA